MTEYLYDAIRTDKHSPTTITAYITDVNDETIQENCHLTLYNGIGTVVILEKNGEYLPEALCWEFLLTTEEQEPLYGRYLYSISHNNESLQFKQPIYFL